MIKCLLLVGLACLVQLDEDLNRKRKLVLRSYRGVARQTFANEARSEGHQVGAWVCEQNLCQLLILQGRVDKAASQ
jgi:hypothetical protein